MKKDGYQVGGRGLANKKLKKIAPHDSFTGFQLVKLRRELNQTQRLPHEQGEPRIYRLVRENLGGSLYAKLKELDAEYTFDEMMLLPDVVKYIAFTEGGEYDLLRDDYMEYITLSASYQVLAEYFKDKSRTEVIRVLKRARALSEFYGVSEAELSRCALNLARFLSEGDVEYYLNDGYETTVKNVLKRKRLPRFIEEPEPAFSGFRREDHTGYREELAKLRDCTLKFFAENCNADGLIASSINMRAKVKSDHFTPSDAAACVFYLICALDFGAMTAEQFKLGARRILKALERAEKWRGFLFAFTDLSELKPVGLRYVPSYDAAMLYTALRLLKKTAVECAAADAEEHAAKLLSRMDLTVFQDKLRDRFRLGYFTDREAFDESCYTEMYGNGLLLHMATGVSINSLEEIVQDNDAALIVNLLYPVYPYIKPRLPKKPVPFYQFYLCNLFYDRVDKIADSLYACCNWGMSERGDLEDLVYRPLSNALILLSMNRENILRRMGETEGMEFRKPFYLPQEPLKRNPAGAYLETGGKLQKHTLTEGELSLVADNRGNVRVLRDGEEQLFWKMYAGSERVAAGVEKYRFLPDEVRYIASFPGARLLLCYRLSGGVSLTVKRIELTGGGLAGLTAFAPKEAQTAFYDVEKASAFEPDKLAYDADFALKTLGAETDGYDGVYAFAAREFTLQATRLPARDMAKVNTYLEHNAAVNAVLSDLGVLLAPKRLQNAKKATLQPDLSGRFGMVFEGYTFTDFTYCFPAGKYLINCSPMRLHELDILLYDSAEKQVYSPLYAPLYLEATYSVTLDARGVIYTAVYREFSFALTLKNEGGDLQLSLKISSLLPRRSCLSLYVLPGKGLAKFSPQSGAVKSELPLAKYGETGYELRFSTSLGLSHNAQSRYVLDVGNKRKNAVFNRMLMPAAENLPRYIDYLGERAGDRQLAVFTKLLLSFDAAFSRRLLLRLFARQNLDGALTDRTVSYLLPFLLHAYLDTTGDTDVLEVETGYADSQIRDAVKYHAMKCLELTGETAEERMLTVFMLDGMLNCPQIELNRLNLIRRREELKNGLLRQNTRTEDEEKLYALCIGDDASDLYRSLAQRLENRVLCFGLSAETDLELALYIDLLITRVFGLRRRGDTLSFDPMMGEAPERVALKCEFGESKLSLTYGQGEERTVNVDGIDVSGDTRIRLPQKKRALKVHINI